MKYELCPFCKESHPQVKLQLDGHPTRILYGCTPEQGERSSGHRRNLGEELNILQARVESIARELSIVKAQLRDRQK